MKILLYVYYFFRSVSLRGFFNTISLIRFESKWERYFGINTAKIHANESENFYHYQGASYKVLFQLFSQLPAHLTSRSFIDIGCGKGRVLVVAAKSGFTSIKGIELNKELCSLAVDNVSKAKHISGNYRIEVVNINALEFEFPDKPMIYFLFNPFSEDVLRAVLRKINKIQRETWFIYMNPLYIQPFQEIHAEEIQIIKTQRYTEAIIFRTHHKMPLTI